MVLSQHTGAYSMSIRFAKWWLSKHQVLCNYYRHYTLLDFMNKVRNLQVSTRRKVDISLILMLFLVSTLSNDDRLRIEKPVDLACPLIIFMLSVTPDGLQGDTI
jgi:hypothetical protein